jgi:hypothetical protein
MRTFVVECYWPGMIELEARATLDRVVRLGGEALPGQSVRLLGCIVLHSDGLALFLFNAPSEAVVKHTASRVPGMCPECVRVFHIQTTTKVDLQALFLSPLTDSNGLPPPYHGGFALRLT